MTPFIFVIKRILLRPQASWSCLSAAIYVPLRLRHSQEVPSKETTATFSKETLHGYIGRNIRLANLELNALMEQEQSTKSLSVEQLGMIDVQDAMSAHPPPTCFFLQLQVFFSRTSRLDHVRSPPRSEISPARKRQLQCTVSCFSLIHL